MTGFSLDIQTEGDSSVARHILPDRHKTTATPMRQTRHFYLGSKGTFLN